MYRYPCHPATLGSPGTGDEGKGDVGQYPDGCEKTRNSIDRTEFVTGRDAIRTFLASKLQRELDYRLVKSLWAFTDKRIAVRYQYEWHDASGLGHPATATSCGSSTSGA